MPPPRRRAAAVRAAWPQAVAVLVGVLFVVLGVMGFGATGIDRVAQSDDLEVLFGLGVNPLQNVVHVAMGVAGIVLSARLRGARRYGWVLAAVFGALFVYGAVVDRAPHADVLNTNWPVNWVHAGFAVLGLVIALAPATPRPVPDATPPPAKATETSGTSGTSGTSSPGAEPSVVEAVAEPRESLREQA